MSYMQMDALVLDLTNMDKESGRDLESMCLEILSDKVISITSHFTLGPVSKRLSTEKRSPSFEADSIASFSGHDWVNRILMHNAARERDLICIGDQNCHLSI